MTEKDVEEIMANPIYLGLGAYPRIISDEQFIKCGVLAIKKYGAERYLKTLINNLHKYI